jgi:hypothetical protein
MEEVGTASRLAKALTKNLRGYVVNISSFRYHLSFLRAIKNVYFRLALKWFENIEYEATKKEEFPGVTEPWGRRKQGL